MNFIRQIIIFFLMAIACYGIYDWRVGDLSLPEVASVGRDATSGRKAQSQDTNIGEHFLSFSDEKIESDISWSQFRGAKRDNIVEVDSASLNFDFNNTKLDVLWRIPLGEGYASPAIYKGKVYVLDYDEQEGADMLRCFSFDSGKELWRRWYKLKIKRNHGVSRTVPVVAEGVVVAIAPLGHIMAVDADSGELLWTKDLVKEYGSVIPQWYTGQCPIVDNGCVIIAPAGKEVLLMGLDLRSGKEVFTSENSEAFNMSHSSIMKVDIAGKSQYIYCGLGGSVGVSAQEEDLGEVLWINKDFKPNVFAPSPVYLDNGKFLLTAGYGAGGALLQVSQEQGEWKTSLLKRWKPKEAISSEQQSPIFYNGKIYSIMPKDAGKNHSRFICANTDADMLYISDTEYKFGLGPYILLGDTFLILDDNGVLYSLREEGEAFKVLGVAKILNGHDSWGPLAYADSKLIARDMDEMVCIGLAKKGAENE